jgi:hypothetical protein
MATCGKNDCEIPFSDESKTIVCSGFCNVQFHTKCASVSRQTENFLASTKNVLWFCDSCIAIQKSGSIKYLINEVRKCKEDNRGLAKSLLNSVKQEIDKSKNELLSKSDEIQVSYADTLKNWNKKSAPKNDSVVVIKPKDKIKVLKKQKLI